jgi:hypothetical protein
MARREGKITTVSPPSGEFWPAVVCRCGKILARLRDGGEAGLAVMIVDLLGRVPRYSVENMNDLAYSQQRTQTRLFRIAHLDRGRAADDGGLPPQSYEFTCRSSRSHKRPRLVRENRLHDAARAAASARRDRLELGTDL